MNSTITFNFSIIGYFQVHRLVFAGSGECTDVPREVLLKPGKL